MYIMMKFNKHIIMGFWSEIIKFNIESTWKFKYNVQYYLMSRCLVGIQYVMHVWKIIMNSEKNYKNKKNYEFLND